MAEFNSVKQIVAANLSALRQQKGLTQLQLAEKLNYSDKAISKWERGESLPDLDVLIKLAELYDVDLNYLTSEKHEPAAAQRPKKLRLSFENVQNNRILILIMSVILIWLIASVLYVILTSKYGILPIYLMCFFYAIPSSLIVWLVLNSVWFKGRRNILIVSLLMWSVLLAVFLSFLVFGGRSFPLVFILGIPGQIILICCSHIVLARSLPLNRFENDSPQRAEEKAQISGKY